MEVEFPITEAQFDEYLRDLPDETPFCFDGRCPVEQVIYDNLRWAVTVGQKKWFPNGGSEDFGSPMPEWAERATAFADVAVRKAWFDQTVEDWLTWLNRG